MCVCLTEGRRHNIWRAMCYIRADHKWESNRTIYDHCAYTLSHHLRIYTSWQHVISETNIGSIVVQIFPIVQANISMQLYYASLDIAAIQNYKKWAVTGHTGKRRASFISNSSRVYRGTETDVFWLTVPSRSFPMFPNIFHSKRDWPPKELESLLFIEDPAATLRLRMSLETRRLVHLRSRIRL